MERKTTFAIGEYYHLYNRGTEKRKIFLETRDYQRFIVLLHLANNKEVVHISNQLYQGRSLMELLHIKIPERLVALGAYCLMPNHFHFLLKQVSINGISKFLSNFQNAYTRYFNAVHERTGQLFLNQFKTVRVETDEQFIHVSRYIHLNALTSYVVKDFASLIEYPWSSLSEYINPITSPICDTEIVLDFFKDRLAYREFLKDQIDYQRELHKIQHLLLE